MKSKLLLVFLLVLFSIQGALAQDLSAYCAQPHDLSTKPTRFFSKITGTTAITQNIANSLIKKELRNTTGSKALKAKIKTFSATDLLDGRFKSLTLKGSNLNFNGVYITNFDAKTICSFNNIKANKSPVVFKDNFAMQYDMLLSSDDLNKTLNSPEYQAILSMLNVKSFGINLFNINKVNVSLDSDKFIFSLLMNNDLFGYKVPINMNVSTKLAVENGKIKVSELLLDNNKNSKINLSQLASLLNVINPISVSTNILGSDNAKVAVDNLKIEKNKLNISGTLFVPKSQTVY